MKTFAAAALLVLSSASHAWGLDAALRSAGIPISGPSYNLSCGIAPIPPIGCRVGQCVCDGMGQNCRWTFVCS
jgi:hypothetical protein